MKKNILSIFCCLSLLTLASCSDDYNDASTKHVYGENEDPYLKVDEDAQITQTETFKINIASSTTQTVVKLEDYAEQFETQLGMSVDGVLSGLEDGSVVFYPINASRNKWTKTAYTRMIQAGILTQPTSLVRQMMQTEKQLLLWIKQPSH